MRSSSIVDARARRRACPRSASSSRRARRARTSANSAATKKPLSSTSTTTARRSERRVMRGAAARGTARRYFGRRRRRSSGRRREGSKPRGVHVGDATRRDLVDPSRERVVGIGQPALGVRGERQPHLVPAVDEDVRVVVGLLGQRRRRGSTNAIAAVKSSNSKSRTSASRSLRPVAHPASGHTCSRAHRLPRPVGHRDAVRARPRRRGHRRHARVRPPAGGARAAEGHARRDRPRPRRPTRSTARCASSPSRAARSTSSTSARCSALAPDLIVTQALCAVCAVSFDDVRAIAERMDPAPEGRRARPAHARRGARRRPHARPGHRRQGRGRRRSSQDAAERIDRVRLAVRGAPRPSPSPRSSGSTRSSSPATGRRS